MKRMAGQKLLDWKNSARRKPIILRGARQVGKTWLVEQVLAPHFTQMVKIDFEKRRDIHQLFSENLDPKSILNVLELTSGRIRPGETLLFFDEIQACPRAIMALRYFYEEMPELHLVAAGSLLEFAFSDISVPVGRVQYLTIYPMTFYEYLLALGKEVMAEHIVSEPSPVPSTVRAVVHEQIIRELRNYFIIGGMPECVRVWRDTHSMTETGLVQSEIIDSCRDDFAKYTPHTEPTCLNTVLLNVAKSVGEQLKYVRLDDSFSGPTNRKAFDLLIKAGLIHKIPSCNPSGLPLGATANPKKFKAAFLDIGLMQRLCQLPLTPELQQENLLAIYQGKLAEQFVAQEMLAAGKGELFYWSREAHSSNAEVDYLAVREGNIYPVEVKAGAAGTLRSMHSMLKNYPHCPEGIVLSIRPFSRLPEQRLCFLPLYYAAAIVLPSFSLPS